MAETGEAPTGEAKEPFKFGSITLHPHVSYGVTYGNGIQSAPGQPQNTVMNTLTGGCGFELGKVWHLDYTAAATFYSERNFRNTVDQYINLSGSTTHNDWTYGLSQNVAFSSDVQVETAQQTDQQTYDTALTASRLLTANLTLDLAVAQNIRAVDGLTNTSAATPSSVGSSSEWSTTDGLSYQINENFGTGIGATFGYASVDLGTDRMYEEVQGRFQWHVVRKVTFSFSGGANIQQFIDSGQPSLVTPVFEMTLRYQPVKETVISLSGGRTVSTSYYQDQLTENTSIGVSVNQQLFQHFSLGLAGGYANTSYHATAMDVTSGREDNYTYFSASLSTRLFKRGIGSISYSRSTNRSNSTGFGFTSNQVGLQLAYSY